MLVTALEVLCHPSCPGSQGPTVPCVGEQRPDLSGGSRDQEIKRNQAEKGAGGRQDCWASSGHSRLSLALDGCKHPCAKSCL